MILYSGNPAPDWHRSPRHATEVRPDDGGWDNERATMGPIFY
jgi:hypothetical protein